MSSSSSSSESSHAFEPPVSVMCASNIPSWVDMCLDEELVEENTKGVNEIVATSLFMKLVWSSLSLSQKHVLEMEAMTQRAAGLNVKEGRPNSINAPFLLMGIWSIMNEESKSVFQEAARKISKRGKNSLPKWGSESSIVFSKCLEKDLQLNIRWSFQRIMTSLQSKLKASRIPILKWDKHALMPIRIKKLKKVKIEISIGYVVWKHFWSPRLAQFELKQNGTRETSYYMIDTMSGISNVFTYHERKAWVYTEGPVTSCIGIKLHDGFDVGYKNLENEERVTETNTGPFNASDYKVTCPRLRYNRKSEKMILMFPRMTLLNGLLNVSMSS